MSVGRVFYEHTMGRIILIPTTLACACLLSCAAVFLQTDDFPDKLKKGCDTLASCEQLETEAKARTQRCQDNTMGYIRCSDAQADLIVASSYADKWREKAQRDEQERAERERKKDQAQQGAEQQRREQLRESAELAAQEQKENERRVREAKVVAAKQAEHDKAAEYIKLLGPSGREQRIRTCVKDYGPRQLRRDGHADLGGHRRREGVGETSEASGGATSAASSQQSPRADVQR